MPNSKFRIFFIPYDISASDVCDCFHNFFKTFNFFLFLKLVKGLIIFDAAGLLLGWKMFDHAGIYPHVKCFEVC